jgi:hypothetical protein
MKWTAKEIVIDVIFSLIVAFVLWAAGHGIYCDYIRDEMHGTECYWCSLYRFANLDNAAFQTRELRRDGRK